MRVMPSKRWLVILVSVSLATVSMSGFVLAPVLSGGLDPYFDPPHSYLTIDSDLDGDYDFFRVNARVTLASAIPFTVYIRAFVSQLVTTDHPSDANLTTAEFKRGPMIEILATISPGTAIHTLTDDARPLFLSGYTGTWTIHLVMTDSGTGQVYSRDSFDTSSLSWSSFDPTEADLTASSSDYAQDLNGDGKKDVLRVNVTFSVGVAGGYAVNGFLLTNDWSEMFSNATFGPASFALGTHTVQLSFDVTCCQSNLGPFRVWARIGEAGSSYANTLYDEQHYTTTTIAF